MAYINLNGKITNATDAHIPIDNGAFRYGYGLFETMLVQNATIRLQDYHWDRLFTGMEALYFALPAFMTPEYLEEQVLRTIEKNGLINLCRVRLQVYGPGGGLYGPADKPPGFLIECFPLEESIEQLNENGLVVGIATGIGKVADTLSHLKTCNALIYAIAARQAKANKWNDALICNAESNIIESTIANIFWIKDGTIYTPPLTDGCVAGVMRQYVMETIEVVEKSLTVFALLEADEVFLTNAIKKIRWVRAIDGSLYSNTRTKAIFDLLQPF